mmetsp:Transcript_3247/g.7709  ORF Transcript_3247/g.7709 Transcript_3247/m.7709 type:complete len:478 (-) Transcript_3247:1023-2456(-)
MPYHQWRPSGWAALFSLCARGNPAPDFGRTWRPRQLVNASPVRDVGGARPRGSSSGPGRFLLRRILHRHRALAPLARPLQHVFDPVHPRLKLEHCLGDGQVGERRGQLRRWRQDTIGAVSVVEKPVLLLLGDHLSLLRFLRRLVVLLLVAELVLVLRFLGVAVDHLLQLRAAPLARAYPDKEGNEELQASHDEPDHGNSRGDRDQPLDVDEPESDSGHVGRGAFQVGGGWDPLVIQFRDLAVLLDVLHRLAEPNVLRRDLLGARKDQRVPERVEHLASRDQRPCDRGPLVVGLQAVAVRVALWALALILVVDRRVRAVAPVVSALAVLVEPCNAELDNRFIVKGRVRLSVVDQLHALADVVGLNGLHRQRLVQAQLQVQETLDRRLVSGHAHDVVAVVKVGFCVDQVVEPSNLRHGRDVEEEAVDVTGVHRHEEQREEQLGHHQCSACVRRGLFVRDAENQRERPVERVEYQADGVG